MHKLKEIPLANITLRKYEKPYRLKGRELIRKLCLSLGLLQPKDSRDIIVDILHVMLKAGHAINCKEIEKRTSWLREKNKLEIKGITPANVRRQLRRLKELMIIDKQGRLYFITEEETLKNIFEEKIKRFYIEPTIERIKEYCEHIDNLT